MLYGFVLGWNLGSPVNSSCLEGRTENPAGWQAIRTGLMSPPVYHK